MNQSQISSVKSYRKIVLFLAAVIFLAGGFAIAGWIFTDKPVVVSTSNRLYQLFLGKEHQKVIQQLDKFNKVILVGNRKDGLYVFIDYYASFKTKEGFLIKKRVFQEEEDLKYERFPLLAKGYHYLHLQFGSKQTEPNLWIIQTRSVLNTSELEHIASFAEAHPNHRFIIAANETKSSKDSHGFKKITFPKPSEAEFMLLLKDQKLPKVLSKNILKYHNNSINFLSHLVNLENVQKVFNSYFSEQTGKLELLVQNSSKASEILSVICEKGLYPSKKQVKGISPYNGVIVFDEKAYYWSSLKNIYAYSNKNGQICDTNVRFVSAPEEPEPVVVQTVQVKSPEPIVAKADEKVQQITDKKKAGKAKKGKKGK